MESRIFWVEKSCIADVARALDSDLRRKMLDLLSARSLNVNQLSEALGIPQSTCTLNVQILEKAKLIRVEQVPASKGSQKICSVPWEEVVIPLKDAAAAADERVVAVDMPIGLYTDYRATAPCGMLAQHEAIGFYDQTETFLNPKRAAAGLIWFTKGYLEYRFPKVSAVDPERIAALSVTMELCSEFPGFNNAWPSDITVWFNGLEVGTWRSPGDTGGEYGRFTPRWWDLANSQYGYLKTWRVTPEGSFIDGVRAGGLTLQDVVAGNHDSYRVRVGVKDDAEYSGGLNLFGRTFGNYEQDIVLRLELRD